MPGYGLERKPNERGSGFGRGRIHADFSSRLPTLKLHHAGHAGEQGMISAEIHIETGKEFRAALPNDNTAGFHGFSAIGLHAQILWVTVPPVS